ncbi:MAG: SIR2 family protein [Balneolales bacterium]
MNQENKESITNDKNILKSRDDFKPIFFESVEEDLFKLSEGVTCSWHKSDEPFGKDKIRQRIEPWLTALVQSEHLSLLLGSGLTHSVHWLAKNQSLLGMQMEKFNSFSEQISIISKESAIKAGRSRPNIEDQIRVANEISKGLENYLSISNEKSDFLIDEAKELKIEIDLVLKRFAISILEGESSIANAHNSEREKAFGYLVNFLMSFASRSGTRDRLQIFTTNYDRLIEAGAEVAGLHLLDRFVGTLTPIFRSSRLNLDMHYNPPGIRGEPRYLEGVARFSKLHGSVDWINSERDIRRLGIPFGSKRIEPFLNAPGLTDSSIGDLIIYPNSAKDRETADYPFVELFRDFAASACRPNNTLIAYGYSFGDEHINRIIEDMLTIPSTHLVIISYSDPLGLIMKTYERIGRPAQITLMIGEHLGNLKTLVDHYLPKSAIDRTTFRMSELLKTRFGTDSEKEKDENNNESTKL